MNLINYLAALAIVASAALIPLLISKRSHDSIIRASYWLLLLAVGSGLYQLVHLIEEAQAEGIATTQYLGWLLAGLVFFGGIDLIVHRSYHKAEPCDCDDCDTPAASRRALPYILTNFAHAVMDGLIIVAGFIAGPVTGFTAALLVLAHEAPKQAGGFGHLVQVAGLSPAKAVRMALLVTLSGITLPMLLSLIVGAISLPEVALPFVAGGFASLVLRQLWSSFTNRKARPLWVVPAGVACSFMLAAGLMSGVSDVLGHNHAHGEGHEHHEEHDTEHRHHDH